MNRRELRLKLTKMAAKEIAESEAIDVSIISVPTVVAQARHVARATAFVEIAKMIADDEERLKAPKD